MINTITSALKDILAEFGFTKKITDEEIECAIDDEVVDCEGEAFVKDALNYYTGVPAPAYLEDDKWFGTAVVSEKGQDYMVQETEIKQQEAENRQYWTKEPEDIHQVMYEMATKSGATTVQLDPIGGSENFQGGSENVHR
jgi:hypothetical protein